MTSMADCLQRAIDFGAIDRQRGIAIRREYDQLVDRYRSIMPDAQARARAAADLKEANAAKTARRRHVVLNQLQAMARIRNLILTAKDPARALRGLIEYEARAGSKGESVRSLAEAYESSINAELYEVLHATGSNLFGNSRNVKLLENLIRELHDEATGDAAAKALAKTVRKVQQRMRRAANSYGMDIGDLADFGVTHRHDADQIQLKGFKIWSESIYKKLAWDRIIDHSTAKAFAAKGALPPFADVQAFLKDVYDGITTRGWDDRDPSLSVGGRALANQRAEHRVLHFKDGSAWLEYNREFGTQDPFSAMIGGLHGLGRDVAMMRVLGPNHRAGLAYAVQVAEKQAAELDSASPLPRGWLRRNPSRLERVTRAGKTAKAMLAHQDGSANRAHHVGWARFFGGTRSYLSSVQLGSAVVSSVTDAATIQAASSTVGMSGRNVMSRSVELMASQATRDTAARMGYVAETLADTGASMARYFGKTFGTGLPERMSSFTLRATGLSAVTDFRKIAFQMEFAGHLADMADKPFAQIDPRVRTMLERRGITAQDWDLMRDPSTRFYPQSGGGPNGGPSMTGPDFMSPFYWLENQTALSRVEAEGLAMRWQMAIQEQMEMAIPSASLRGKAMLQGEAPPGSFLGELARSSTSYKSFSLSMMLNQYDRFMEIEGGWNKAYYAAKLSTMLILTGALAVQLKELVKGNDPRPMDTGKFWTAALFQGGGLGIFGDFFASEQSRAGGGIAETIAGPVVGLASDLLGPVASNLTAALKGEKTYWGRDAANLLRMDTPFFSSAWPVRTAFSRIVADYLQALLDPESELLSRRRLKKLLKDYGTQPYTPVLGAGGSFRLPDLSNALGGEK